mgnify:CR=1 FL=1
MRRIPRRIPTARSRIGFTLVEMLVVLGILVVLVSLVAPRIIGSQKKADIKAAKTQIGMIKAALEHYALDTKSYPTTEQGLQALIERPADLDESVPWEGPYLSGSLPKDPWGNDYMYEYPGTHTNSDQPEIWSLGPDKEDNTEDDICSWDRTAEGTGELGTTSSETTTPIRPRTGRTTSWSGAMSEPKMPKAVPPPETKPVRSPRSKEAEF